MKLPECSGYKSWTDWGYEYDCESQHEESCDYCLATYKEKGGLWNPETGKYTPKIIALIKYGPPRRNVQNINDSIDIFKNGDNT